MAHRPRERVLEHLVEADRFEDAPHPRESVAFFGHVAAERTLAELYLSGQMPHALLLGGPPGIGKATLAWRLARFILANPDPTASAGASTAGLRVSPDNPVARQIIALAHPDLALLRRTWNSKERHLFKDIRVGDVRRAAQMFRQSSGRDGFRICILDSAEDLNAESANALLKIIEEPPPRSLFLLVAHRSDRVLPTIRSRCRKLSLKPLRAEDISDVILSLGPPWSDAGDAERFAASSRARGSVHEAMRRLGTSGSRITAIVEDLLSGLPQLDWDKVHALADEVARPDGAEAFDTMLIAAFDWLDRQARLGCFAGQGARIDGIVACASAWEAVAGRARRMTSFNLDRRPVVWSLFAELAAASRTIGSRDQFHR